jgi:tetratricopeptide (TPR) repeat protein
MIFVSLSEPGQAGVSMNTFSTADIAKILDVRPEWIRAQARGPLIHAERTRQGHFRYSFQDLVLLRTARGLRKPGVSPRRILHSLHALLKTLPSGRSLSSMKIESDGRNILAGENNVLWDPESGQTSFVFATAAADRARADEHPLAQLPTRERTAGAWFELALEHEKNGLPRNAEAAYRRTCELDSGHVNARINLGRLRHSLEAHEDAEAFYREALRIDPRHPIALFNLGVVLEDTGALESAIECYKLSIESDPEIPEAHYNLARLYARSSDQLAAVRHYAAYRTLTRKEDS